MTALQRVVDPLVDLMLDAGITVGEFSRLVRERAVRLAASRLANESGRRSNSRVAIVTGLARAEVARILTADEVISDSCPGQHPARRVLAAWYESRRFLSRNGEPAILPIFGKRRSFEQLVAAHSGGIPVRAMLDQLVQIDAVDVLPEQRVKAKSRFPIFKGMTTTAISNVGERAGDLLGTLGRNLRTASSPLFEGTALVTEFSVGAVPLLRRELAEQGAAFIDSATSLLARSRSKSLVATSKGRPAHCRVGVTVYYFQDEIASESALRTCPNPGRRKNLQRRSSNAKLLPDTRSFAKSSRGKRP
jgi:hypothetical protein